MVSSRLVWALVPVLAAGFTDCLAEESASLFFQELLKDIGLDLTSPEVMEGLKLVKAYEALHEALPELPTLPALSGSDDANAQKTRRLLDSVRRSGWFSKIMKKTKKRSKDECVRLKEEGHTPESRHSPLKSFGYVTFDVESRKHTIFPGLTLSKVNGFPVPIRVGSRDYVIQGDAASILMFLYCYSDYEVRGARLTEKGEWDEEEQTDSPLLLQVENVGPEAFGSVKYLLYTHTVETLLKSINPMAGFMGAIGKSVEALPQLSPMLKNAAMVAAAKWMWIKHLYHLAASLSFPPDEAAKVWQELAEVKEFSDRARRFVELLKEESRKHRARQEWSGSEGVNLTKGLTLTITMYPKPQHDIRATYALRSSRVTVGDVFEAVAKLLSGAGAVGKLPDFTEPQAEGNI